MTLLKLTQAFIVYRHIHVFQVVLYLDHNISCPLFMGHYSQLHEHKGGPGEEDTLTCYVLLNADHSQHSTPY